MNFTKKLIATCFLGLATVFTGCLTDGDDDEVNITLSLSASSAAVGTKVYLNGDVKADQNVTAMAVTITLDGEDATSDFTIDMDAAPSKTSFDLGKEGDEVEISITPKSSAASGSYVVSLKVTAGATSTTKTATLEVTGGNTGTPVTTESISMGGQGHLTLGSSLDADNMTVMLKAAATAAQGSIDLLFLSAVNGTEARLYSPAEAKVDGYNLIESWTTLNDTKFYKTSMTSAEFDAIATQEEIDALWDASKVLTPGELHITGAMVIILKTDQGKTSLLKVESVSSQSTTAVLTAKGTK